MRCKKLWKPRNIVNWQTIRGVALTWAGSTCQNWSQIAATSWWLTMLGTIQMAVLFSLRQARALSISSQNMNASWRKQSSPSTNSASAKSHHAMVASRFIRPSASTWLEVSLRKWNGMLRSRCRELTKALYTTWQLARSCQLKSSSHRTQCRMRQPKMRLNSTTHTIKNEFQSCDHWL